MVSKVQSLDFTSCSTARVILGQVQVVSKLASSHRLSPLYGFNSHKLQMLRPCLNMALAVEWGAKHQFLTYVLITECFCYQNVINVKEHFL